MAFVAQLVMVIASFFANRLIRWRGYWWAILITFVALPVRGLIAASVIHAAICRTSPSHA